jgi:hypothetical protein
LGGGWAYPDVLRKSSVGKKKLIRFSFYKSESEVVKRIDKKFVFHVVKVLMITN